MLEKTGEEKIKGWQGYGDQTYPSDPTVKPTGFSTLANTPSCSPATQYQASINVLLKTTQHNNRGWLIVNN